MSLTAIRTEINGIRQILSEQITELWGRLNQDIFASALLVYAQVKAAAAHDPSLKALADELEESYRQMCEEEGEDIPPLPE